MHPDKIRALCSPDEPLDQTISLVSKAMEAEPLLDAQLANLLLGRSSHQALLQPTALRILEVLDSVSQGTRLAGRSKAALVIGHRTESFDWIDAQLTQAEPRVRASILEALWENREMECLKVFARYRDDGDNRVAGNTLYGLYLCGEADAIPSVVPMAPHKVPRYGSLADGQGRPVGVYGGYETDG